MSVESPERQTVIHVNIGDNKPTNQQSYSLKEVLGICRLDQHVFWNLSHGEFADFWRADNHRETIHEPGKPGRKKRPDPRFHPEHVEYMVVVINGIMTNAEARDLWNLRKGMIRSELTARALSLTTRRGKVNQK